MGTGRRWYSWLRHCATSRKVAGSIPDLVIGIFHWHNPSDRTTTLGLTQPPREMSTRNISCGVKVAGARGWQPYHFHAPVVLKSGSLNLPEPSGPVQGCKGIALPFKVLLRRAKNTVCSLLPNANRCAMRFLFIFDYAAIPPSVIGNFTDMPALLESMPIAPTVSFSKCFFLIYRLANTRKFLSTWLFHFTLWHCNLYCFSYRSVWTTMARSLQHTSTIGHAPSTSATVMSDMQYSVTESLDQTYTAIKSNSHAR